MADIRHRVGIAAPQPRVYEALTTTEGLSRWWTRDLDGDPKQGGSLRFFFGAAEPGAVMDVVETTPPSHVGLHCAEGPDEWVGTNLSFHLSPSGEETVVVFTHGDWRRPVEFMHHCSTKWAYFLLGMKAWLEGGEATAFPGDMKISSWG
jgi:uncharacterized protein YndB with AHSA1/START domain